MGTRGWISLKSLKTPPTLQEIRSLSAGEVIYFSGKIFTARDAAHKKMLKGNIPFDLKGSLVIFHAGPIMKKEGEWKCVGIGPTTSARMDEFTPKIIEKFGIRAIIGKGGVNKESIAKMNGKCVYLSFTGGASALGAAAVKRVTAFHWPKLGMVEGVWEIEVENLGPLVVAIDANGKSIYEKENKK
jgi:fumarate hydratase subunit beta